MHGESYIVAYFILQLSVRPAVQKYLDHFIISFCISHMQSGAPFMSDIKK